MTVTATPASGNDPVYRETVAVPPGGETDRFDVCPGEGTSLVAAGLPDGRSGEGRIDSGGSTATASPPSRSDPTEVFVERLGVDPGTTATPCSG